MAPRRSVLELTKHLLLPIAVFATSGTANAKSEQKPQVMVLGTIHFANPGLDQINIKVEDVLTPDRQKELERLVEALARFRPSHIAVEWHAAAQADLDRAYAAWRAGDRSKRDERHQIAFRLAEKLGLQRVDAVDWQGEPPGPEASYDFISWARDHGRSKEVDAIFAPLQADTDALQRRMPCLTVSQWLRAANGPEAQRRNALAYYDISLMGDASVNPGADWVGGSWYARNLKVWANLKRLSAKLDERILVVFGSGHRPLLEQYARESGTFTVVNPLNWLPNGPRAAGARC